MHARDMTGEAKHLHPPQHELRAHRDSFVVVALDREEIFRTAVAEKTNWWVGGCVCTMIVDNIDLCPVTQLQIRCISRACLLACLLHVDVCVCYT